MASNRRREGDRAPKTCHTHRRWATAAEDSAHLTWAAMPMCLSSAEIWPRSSPTVSHPGRDATLRAESASLKRGRLFR